MRGVIFMSCLVATPLLGCAWDPPSDVVEPIGVARSGIVHGAVDTAHRPVVAFWGQGNCTATIIKARDDKAFALTAAHCCAPSGTIPMRIGVGDNVSEPDATFDVVDALSHPFYNGKEYDFCLLTFTGASAQIHALGTIPPIAPEEDFLSTGDELDFVGYGITKEGPGDALRRHVTVGLTSVTGIDVVYDQSEGGPCFGDSGGPGLITVNGTEVIGAVISKGIDDCAANGRSGRVSAVYKDFIEPFLAGHAPASSKGSKDGSTVDSIPPAWTCTINGSHGRRDPGLIWVFAPAAFLLGRRYRIGRRL